jgi:hypothetical protein
MKKGEGNKRIAQRAARSDSQPRGKKEIKKSEYSPTVEARRTDYQRLAECLITLAELETQRVHSFLDIVLIDGEREASLAKAIFNHLEALGGSALNWYAPRTLRQFYVEMRLHQDQLKEDVAISSRLHKREDSIKQVEKSIKLLSEFGADASEEVKSLRRQLQERGVSDDA